jgi:hypothetical protein
MFSFYKHQTFHTPENIQIPWVSGTSRFAIHHPSAICLTLRRELKLRVFESRVLRRIFGPKVEEVMGYKGKS